MSQSNLHNGKNGAPISTSAPHKVELQAQLAPANDTTPASVVTSAVRSGLLGLPRTYWMLWSGMLFNRIGGTVFFLLGIYLTRERGLSAELAGLVISLYASGGLVAGPLGGVLADRIGRRATLLFGTACAGTAMLALGFAHSAGSIAALAPVVGFFTHLCPPALQAAVADVVAPQDRKRAYGVLYWAINLGFAVASAFGGALAERHFTLLFVIDALTTFGYGVIVFFGVPETRPARAAGAPAGSGGAAVVGSFVAPLRDRPFVSFVLIQVLLLLAFAQVIVSLPLDMRAHGLGLAEIGWLLGLNGLTIVIAQPIALRLLRGVGHLHWLVGGALLTGLGLGATAFAGGAVVYVLSGLLWTFGEIGWSTAAPAIVADLSPAQQRGAYQGTYQLTWGIASVGGPALGSLVLARLGPTVLWVGCMGVCFGACLLHLWVTGRSTLRAQNACSADGTSL